MTEHAEFVAVPDGGFVDAVVDFAAKEQPTFRRPTPAITERTVRMRGAMIRAAAAAVLERVPHQTAD